MPLACIFTSTWFGPGWGCGTSLICQELLLAGTTAACIFVSSIAIGCLNLKMWHVVFCGYIFVGPGVPTVGITLMDLTTINALALLQKGGRHFRLTRQDWRA